MSPNARFHLTPFEIALVAAVAATSFLCVGLSRPGQKQVKEQGKSSEILQKRETWDSKVFQERLQQNPGLKRRVEIASWGIVLVLMGSLYGVIRLAFRAFKGEPLVKPLGLPAPPQWGLRNILHLALIVLLLAEWLLLTEAFVVLFFHPAWLERNVISLGNTLVIDGVVMIGVFQLLSRGGGPSATARWRMSPPVAGATPLAEGAPFSLGGPRKLWASVRFGIGSYVTALPLFFLLVLLVGMMLEFLHREPTPQPIFNMYLKETRTGVVTALLLLVALVGPAAEELFFRGLLYRWLRSRMGVWRGLLLSGFLFATLHMDWVTFLPIAGLGILLGWVYEKTGSLAAPVAVHIFHNAGMMFLASIVKSIIQ